jgi:cytochrome c peroxidase
MAMPDKASVLAAIMSPSNPNFSDYEGLFRSVYDVRFSQVNLGDPPTVEAIYDMVADAIAMFETSTPFRRFTSKFDYYLQGRATLTPQEQRGLAVFEGPGMCNLCHISTATTLADGSTVPPLFTDFTYDNLGIPKSTNPMIASNPVDLGLGARTDLPEDPEGQRGKFKVSTLRNLTLTAPYGHNGFFATLEEIVHFYNTRDVVSWPPPEVPENVNTDELGNLGLNAQDEADLVAFLKTLTDGHKPAPPRRRNRTTPSVFSQRTADER